MGTDDMAAGVVAWARAAIPELQGGYAYPPTSKEQPLPDVVVDVEGAAMTISDSSFPWHDIQQAWIMRWDVTLSFMVDNSDPVEAVKALRGFADTLGAEALRDGTLGGRVPFTSPLMSFDYTPPFVEYDDGTRGREMTMLMTVGELFEEPQ